MPGYFFAGLGLIGLHETRLLNDLDYLSVELLPTAGEALPDASPLPLDFPVDVASSSSYREFCSMYSTTGAGIKYWILISRRKNILLKFQLVCLPEKAGGRDSRICSKEVEASLKTCPSSP